MQIKESDLHFEDSKSKNDEATKPDAFFYILIIIISILTIAVVASSFLSWRNKQSTQQQKLAK